MRVQLKKSACALALLAATSTSAFAIDVRVIGSITPAACTPTLSGGGTVDYGVIRPAELTDDAYTTLPVKTLAFAITCDAPAKVALRAINGRPDTAAGVIGTGGSGPSDGRAPVDIFGMDFVGVVGLGLDGTDKVGGYGIRITQDSVTADSNSVDSLRQTEGGSVWSGDAYAGILYDPGFSRFTSWAETGTLLPVAFENLTGELAVQAYINHASELDLSKPINFEGLTTIELVYL